MKELAVNGLLSPLEADILKVIWPDRKLKVRQIHDVLKRKRKVALSSVAVLLDRLHEKNIVSRVAETARGGTRYTYFPAKTRNEFEQSVVKSAVDKLIDAFGPVAVNYFNDRFNKKK